jgi:hypothetical protein
VEEFGFEGCWVGFVCEEGGGGLVEGFEVGYLGYKRERKC